MKDLSVDLEPPSRWGDPFAALETWIPDQLTRRAVAIAKHPLRRVMAKDALDVVSDAFLYLLDNNGGWSGLVGRLRQDLQGVNNPSFNEVERAFNDLLYPRILQEAQNYLRRGDTRRAVLAVDLSIPLEDNANAIDDYAVADWNIELERVVREIESLTGGHLVIKADVDDVSVVDLAAQHGVSVAVISSRLYQARQRVRSAVDCPN